MAPQVAAQPADHPAEPTPDQGPDAALLAAVAALLLAGTATALLATSLFRLLRARGRRVTRRSVLFALTLSSRRTKHAPRMVGRSDVARAQRDLEARYRAGYVLRCAERVGAAELNAGALWDREHATDVQAAVDRDARLELEQARRDAVDAAAAAAAARERSYEAAHERARRRRMDAAVQVAEAADTYGPLLGWWAHRDDATTPECRRAHGHNFRADQAPAVGWPGTLHGGTCRCTAGPPHATRRTVDQATGFAPRKAGA